MTACVAEIWGQRSASIDAAIGEVARELGIEGRVRREGVVPHTRAVSILKGSGVLVLFAGTSLFIRPTKLSDYLAALRPILALAPQGSEAAQHIERNGQALYTGESAQELAAVIRRLWRAHSPERAPDQHFPFPHPHPLNWKTSSAQLAATLDKLCDSARLGDPDASPSVK
jgi:hypothetical protein